jgi:septal ring factor EnvC (AmiA/AmiB activator)
MQKLFSEFFRINLGHLVSAVIFLCGLVYSQGKVEERIALIDQRDLSEHREALAMISSTRTERQLQVEELRRRIEAVERSVAASDALLSEVRALNARLTALDQRISELRTDVRDKQKSP